MPKRTLSRVGALLRYGSAGDALRLCADAITAACLWGIRVMNTTRDNQLSRKLYDLAKSYNTRPDEMED